MGLIMSTIDLMLKLIDLSEESAQLRIIILLIP